MGRFLIRRLGLAILTLLLLSFICVAPAVFLLGRPKARLAATADAH